MMITLIVLTWRLKFLSAELYNLKLKLLAETSYYTIPNNTAIVWMIQNWAEKFYKRGSDLMREFSGCWIWFKIFTELIFCSQKTRNCGHYLSNLVGLNIYLFITDKYCHQTLSFTQKFRFLFISLFWIQLGFWDFKINTSISIHIIPRKK